MSRADRRPLLLQEIALKQDIARYFRVVEQGNRLILCFEVGVSVAIVDTVNRRLFAHCRYLAFGELVAVLLLAGENAGWMPRTEGKLVN
jgi:hypothetical protein